MAQAPVFISNDPEQILSECIARYEQLTNRPLLPAQAERFVIQVIAYRENVLRGGVQSAGETQLIDFSTAPMLDYLVAILDVVRLGEQYASTRIEFSLVQGHLGVTIPQGTRVQSQDGIAAFETTEAVFVPAGTYTQEIDAKCTEAGIQGNGYVPNTVSVILDPYPFIDSAINIITTDGGADAESDEQLRARFKLASDRYSTAGPYGAYKYHGMSAHPSIVDLAVLGPNDDVSINPGEVHIFPLVQGGGTTPAPVLAAVYAACNDDKVRPLTDIPIVASPVAVNYDIEIEITCYIGSDDAVVLADTNETLNEFSQDRKKKLGLDVLRNKINSLSMLNPQVYNIAVIQPAVDLILAGNEFANIGTITANIVAHVNG